MPDPRVVIAIGTDAVGGGLLGDRLTGAAGTVPVDIWVPGSPPTPFGILNALLIATTLCSRAPSDSRTGSEPSSSPRASRCRPATAGTLYRQVFDDLDELVAVIAMVPGEGHQLAGAGEDRAAVGRTDDGDTAAAAELNQALVA
jgi:hypothetical protein